MQTRHDSQRAYPPGRTRIDQFGVSWAFRLLPYMEQQDVYRSHDPKKRVDDSANENAMRTPVDTFFCPSRRTPAADRNFDNNDSAPVVEGAAAGGDYAANAGMHYMYGTSPEQPYMDQEPGSVAGPIFTGSRVRARGVTDGLSQTLAVGERHIPTEVTSKPGLEHHAQGDTAFFAGDTPKTIFAGAEKGIAEGHDDVSSEKFGSEHSSLTHFVYLDGHVKGLDRSIDEIILQRLAAIADGQIIPGDAM